MRKKFLQNSRSKPFYYSFYNVIKFRICNFEPCVFHVDTAVTHGASFLRALKGMNAFLWSIVWVRSIVAQREKFALPSTNLYPPSTLAPCLRDNLGTNMTMTSMTWVSLDLRTLELWVEFTPGLPCTELSTAANLNRLQRGFKIFIKNLLYKY